MNLNLKHKTYVEDSADLEMDLWREQKELQKNQEDYYGKGSEGVEL